MDRDIVASNFYKLSGILQQLFQKARKAGTAEQRIVRLFQGLIPILNKGSMRKENYKSM